jgi:hypothetical protein
MKKVVKNYEREELDLLDLGLSKKILMDFKLAFVTFELVGADRSQNLRVELNCSRARLFWRWLEDRGRCEL